MDSTISMLALTYALTYFDTVYDGACIQKAINYFDESVRYTPPADNKLTYKGQPANNVVYIYQMNMYFFSSLSEEVIVTQNIVPFLNTHDHPDGLVVLANIGHHLAAER